MRRKFRKTLILSCWAVSALAVLAAEPPSYKAVATVGMIADIVREVAGDHAEIEGVIGEGVDPHLYKPTRNDVVTLSQADMI